MFRIIHYLTLELLALSLGFKISDLEKEYNYVGDTGTGESAAVATGLAKARAKLQKVEQKLAKFS